MHFPMLRHFSDAEASKSPADLATPLLQEAKVVAVPGEAFGTEENIRVSYATSAGEIDRGIQRMREWFGSL